MTHLRYVVVAGFKSLRDWTLLDLAPGVTVFVGGNGTGKSSMAEAMLWGLGEDDLEQLRISRREDLLFRPRPHRSVAEQELLYHRASEAIPESAGDREAAVYLVLDDDEDHVEGEAEGDSACCCRPAKEGRAEVPTGRLSVGRSVGLDGEPSWELDGAPASSAQVRAALLPLGLDRPNVAVIRQGELERLLVADEPLRADIIADLLGLSLGDGDALPADAVEPRPDGREQDRRSALTGDLLLSAFERWGDGDAESVQLALSRLGLPLPQRSGRSLEDLLGLLDGSGPDDGVSPSSLSPWAVPPAFAEAVSRIDRGFQRIFVRLVGGGEAGLRVARAGHRVGVAVEATFPGHPPVDLDALSGGQRALVAFSLGLAVFEESGAQLLVFDEVEPALDESNLRAFNDLLHEAALGRQIVVISHQRRTKDVGDVVFGFDHVGGGAAGLHFRYEPRTRRLVVFGRVQGNWLDRTAQLTEGSQEARPVSSSSQVPA